MCLKLTPMTWLFWLMLNIYQWRVLHMVITFSAFLCFPKYCWFWSPAWLGHCGVVLHYSCVIQSVLLKTWKTFSPHVCNESWQRTWQNIEKNMTHVFPKPIHAMYSQVHYPNLSRQNMAKQSFWATKVTASGWTIINSQSWRWEYLGEFTLSKLRCSSVASLLFSISSQLFFRSANLRPSWSRWEGLCHFPWFLYVFVEVLPSSLAGCTALLSLLTGKTRHLHLLRSPHIHHDISWGRPLNQQLKPIPAG